eukprot:2358054-Pleurochrysis_carterae.AAC.2
MEKIANESAACGRLYARSTPTCSPAAGLYDANARMSIGRSGGAARWICLLYTSPSPRDGLLS